MRNLFIVVIAVLVVFFVVKRFNAGDKTSDGKSDAMTATAPVAANDQPVEEPPPVAARGVDLREQLNSASPPKNDIERARNATVLVKTSWGFGSGFFVSSDCRILTNKHVVKLSGAQYARAEEILNKRRAFLDQVKQQIEAKRKYFYENCKPDCSQEDYEAFMGDIQDRLAAAEDQVENVDTQLDLSKGERPRVVLADGTEYPAAVERESATHDLVLLKLDGATCPVIHAGDDTALSQGQSLYTIGNPIGLKFTVTSGVFSGFFQAQGVKLIQTDAPINPGNSGGPLLDKSGRAVGINTLVATKAQGIGFAIPISIAMDEFELDSQ